MHLRRNSFAACIVSIRRAQAHPLQNIFTKKLNLIIALTLNANISYCWYKRWRFVDRLHNRWWLARFRFEARIVSHDLWFCFRRKCIYNLKSLLSYFLLRLFDSIYDSVLFIARDVTHPPMDETKSKRKHQYKRNNTYYSL